MLYYSKRYIVSIFLDAGIDDRLDAGDDVTIGKIFGCDFAHLFNETLEILQAVLVILEFIHNGNDPSLKGIVAFSIWD
jgi:hypothetical protein